MWVVQKSQRFIGGYSWISFTPLITVAIFNICVDEFFIKAFREYNESEGRKLIKLFYTLVFNSLAALCIIIHAKQLDMGVYQLGKIINYISCFCSACQMLSA